MTKFEQYAQLKKQIAELENKRKEMENELILDLSEIDGKKMMTEYATFSLSSTRKWEYSKELQEKEAQVKEKLKVMKKDEEITGKAHLVKDGYVLRCQIKD